MCYLATLTTFSLIAEAYIVARQLLTPGFTAYCLNCTPFDLNSAKFTSLKYDELVCFIISFLFIIILL
jgi:hypothetical protein